MFPFNLLGFPYNILAMVAAALALVAGCYFGWEHYVANPYREDGRQEVREEWHKAVVAQQAREEKAAKEADDFQRRADAKRELEFKTLLAQRTAERDAALGRERVGSATLDELRRTTHAANGESSGKPAEDAPTATRTTDGRSLNNWYVQVAKQYRECRETVAGWIKWDDERIAQ